MFYKQLFTRLKNQTIYQTYRQEQHVHFRYTQRMLHSDKTDDKKEGKLTDHSFDSCSKK